MATNSDATSTSKRHKTKNGHESVSAPARNTAQRKSGAYFTGGPGNRKIHMP
jgi:hypothetical protein